MAKITLLGSNSGRNAGDAAILAAIMGILSDNIEEPVEFEVPTTHPDFVSKNYGKLFNVKPLSIMPWTGSVRFIGIPTFRSVKRTDATLITDGIIFDINLWNPLFNFLITLIFIAPWAKFWGKKLVCYDVGIGPLNSFWGRRFAKYVGNSCDLIMVRDEDSKALFEEVGVTKPIHLTADAVFTNWAAPENRIQEIIKAHGLQEASAEGKLFGFNVTRYLDRWLKSSEKVNSKEEFLPMIADALADLKINKGIEPCIVTTQVMDADYGRKLQSLIAGAYQRKAGQAWKPELISNEVYTNHEILGFCSHCELFAGMRLHSLIIASRSGAPVFGLVYAPKVRSFLKQLTTPERSFELASLTKETLYSELDSAWENRAEIKKTQQVVAKQLEAKATEAAQILAKRYYTLKSSDSKETAVAS